MAVMSPPAGSGIGGFLVSLTGTISMHKAKSCAAQVSGGHRLWTVALLVQLGVFAMDGTTPARAAADFQGSPEITGSLPLPEAPYELRTFITKPGAERFELAARLREYGGLITKPVSWRVFRVLGAESGGAEEIYRDDQPIADFSAPPGNYRIDITYGLAVYSRTITLEPSHHISAVFNLNVGGLRVLSKLTATSGPVAFQTAHRIYAVSGGSSGRLIALNATPGEVLRLPAGKYRVESELTPGNAVANISVEIKPGILSAVEIDHVAGIARLGVRGQPNRQFAWYVVGKDGKPAADAEGSSVSMVLTPGTYEAVAVSDTTTLKADFTIASGQSVDVELQP